MSKSRPLKIMLPVDLHLRLHALKILKGRPISQTVEDVLREAFAKDPQPDDFTVVPSQPNGASSPHAEGAPPS